MKDTLDKFEQIQKEIDFLLTTAYLNEFRIINGLSQHPEGLTFEEWKNKIFK